MQSGHLDCCGGCAFLLYGVRKVKLMQTVCANEFAAVKEERARRKTPL